VRVAIARARIDLGDIAVARRELDESIASLGDDDVCDLALEAAIASASGRWALGDRTAATAEARAALDACTRSGVRGSVPLRREIEAWIAEHP
jgi:hypothetical protein